MNKPVTVITKRVDDLPLLLAQLKRMGVQALLDEHFPMHGNWQGVSLGNVTVVWLSHILSQPPSTETDAGNPRPTGTPSCE
jgi:hypothetical protein